MRRSLFVSIITSVTLAPAIALAAFTLPSQVLMSVQFDGKPMDIAFEAHGHMEDMDVSAWISGQSQNHKDIKSAKAALKATVDMQKEGEGRSFNRNHNRCAVCIGTQIIKGPGKTGSFA
jgi:hypothetical protein